MIWSNFSQSFFWIFQGQHLTSCEILCKLTMSSVYKSPENRLNFEKSLKFFPTERKTSDFEFVFRYLLNLSERRLKFYEEKVIFLSQVINVFTETQKSLGCFLRFSAEWSRKFGCVHWKVSEYFRKSTFFWLVGKWSP